MLKDGEKGVIIQRDKKTYAVIPHKSCGVISSDELRKIADVADKYDVNMIKLTSAQRIALVGLEEEQIDPLWKDLDMEKGHGLGVCVRSVKVCPGTDACKRGLQDSIKVGKIIDAKYHGKETPGKMKMAVSGCLFDCSEACLRDIALVGTKHGWRVLVGGNGGNKPRLSRMLADRLSEEEALEMVDKVMEYYENNSIAKQRLGAVIEKHGWDHLLEKLGLLELA